MMRSAAVFAIALGLCLVVPSWANRLAQHAQHAAMRAPRAESQCSGKANTIAPWTGEPRLVKKTTNGSLYTAGEGDDQLQILHVYGTAYEMGYTHGQLLREEATAIANGYIAYAESQIEEYLKVLPKKMADWIADVGLEAALDATEVMTRPFSPAYFYEEMRGLADATGLDYKLVVRIHMLPELIKASCSMLGAWGHSLSGDAASGGMLQLRALDFGTDSILQKYPIVTVYHPDQGHAFANIGWAGWLSTIAGMSSKSMAVSEKVSDIPFGAESRSGIPFNFLMRDILQFDNTIQDSIRRITSAQRTCSIWLGVGSAADQDFRIFSYSASTAKVYTDKNITLVNETRFNREHCDQLCYSNYTAPDLLYWGVHLGCWNEVLMESHGMITPETVISMGGKVKTGDLLSCVYDLGKQEVYIANARAATESGDINAYDRQFVKLDAGSLFKVPQ